MKTDDKIRKRHEKFIGEFGPYIEALKGYARQMTRNDDDANDLAQETLIKAFLNFEIHYQMGSHPKSWLFRIMFNLYLNQYKRQKAYHFEAIDEMVEIPEDREDHLSELIREEEYDCLKKEIKKLKETEQYVLNRYYFKQLKYREIAAEGNLPESTVKTRIRRAKMSLSKTLPPHLKRSA